MSKRATMIATGLALVAVMAVIAVSLLLTGVGGVTAFNTGGSDSAARHMPIPSQYTEQCSNGVAVPNSEDNVGLVTDCAALLAAKEALEGTTGNLNWSADVGISDWDGITVATGRVEGLFLVQRSLNGTIPSALSNLDNLVELHLPFNQLTGAIPPELGNLANLDGLVLKSNQLTGTIPPELGNLANLAALVLSGNQLTGEIPAKLGNLANLTGLDLRVNQLTGDIPSELGNLANLVALELNGNQLTGEIPSKLGRLSNLEYLYLNGNLLTSAIPVELGDASNLEYLHLHDNQLTGDIPSELGNIPNLVELRLNGNRLTGCIPRSLRAPLGDAEIELLGLPICAATSARVIALETQIAEHASVIAALRAQLAEHASRLAALESASVTAPPTPTPSPTPTSVPGTSVACIERIAGNGSVNGNWTPGCLTANSSDNRTYYARFYTFTLYAVSEVTITLSSTDATPYLFLLEGEGMGGAVTRENGVANANSVTITATLQPGAYTIEASTYRAETAGDFTLEMEVTR